MKTSAKFLVAYKLFFALMGFSAIVTEMAVLAERGIFNAVNFFSYFTVLTNVLVFAVLIVSALSVAAGKAWRWLDALRAGATVYILVVGIGFAALLSGLDDTVLTAVPWDNIVLHYIMPAAVLVDFVADRPRKVIGFAAGLAWLVYPVAYVIYSLIRGAVTGWYPYPFLDPATKGYESVVVTVGGLLVLGVVLVGAITWITAWKKRAA